MLDDTAKTNPWTLSDDIPIDQINSPIIKFSFLFLFFFFFSADAKMINPKSLLHWIHQIQFKTLYTHHIHNY